MSFLGTLFIIGVVCIVAIWIITYALYKKSFKHRAIIARPVGDSHHDAVFYDDRFKVIDSRGAGARVVFWKTRGKTAPPPFKVWTKFVRKNKAYFDKEGEMVVKGDIRKAIIRGALFYQTNEKEFTAMSIDKMGNFTVLGEDNKALLVDDIERTKEISLTARDKLIQAGLWLGSLIALGVIVIVVMVVTFDFTREQSLEILRMAGNAAVQGSVGG